MDRYTRTSRGKDTRGLTASKVSIKASSIKKALLSMLKMVELSLMTSSTVDTIASGPLNSVRTAACGRYVKTNMKVVTPIPRVTVGASSLSKGFHKLRWER